MKDITEIGSILRDLADELASRYGVTSEIAKALREFIADYISPVTLTTKPEKAERRTMKDGEECGTCGSTTTCDCWIDADGEWHSENDCSKGNYINDLLRWLAKEGYEFTNSPAVPVVPPRIYTRCPACHNDTLTINKGHLLCTWHECPDPVMIDELVEKGITQEPPPGYPTPPSDPICEPTPADAIPPSSNPNEPVRFGYSREEIYEHAKTFMVETYGPVRESPDKDKWHERYGLLLSFLHDRFPKA